MEVIESPDSAAFEAAAPLSRVRAENKRVDSRISQVFLNPSINGIACNG